MRFEEIEGQGPAVGFLRDLMAQERIPSALLFLGARRVGKRTTALALAQALNCETPGVGCGFCPSCRKIEEGVHPDVEVISPTGQFIRIDQIRALGVNLNLNPFQARKRVIVLSEAEQMNTEAANAFLKTLEEPPEDTLIILCAQRAARLPETIVSRCLPVHFQLLEPATVRKLLSQEEESSAEAVDFAVAFCQGRLREDMRKGLSGRYELREELLKVFEKLEPQAFPLVSDKMAKWAQNEDWRFMLEWLETWFRDVSLVQKGVGGNHLINQDRPETLKKWAEKLTGEGAQACYAQILKTREAIGMNTNKSLALDALWLNLKQITHGQA